MAELDLNADLGEGIGNDAALLDIVTSASIACGGHAGDDVTMRATIRAAMARGVVIGAHPGFADRESFGRCRLVLPPEELDAQIRAQVTRLIEIATEEGASVRYVKLHGALANMAAEDLAIALVAFSACLGLQEGLAVLALDGSAQVEAAELLGFAVIREAYADRGYNADGMLVSRSALGAVLHDPVAIGARAVRLAQRGEIDAVDGTTIASGAQSLCIHGDTPEAVAIATAVRAALREAGVTIGAQAGVARAD